MRHKITTGNRIDSEIGVCKKAVWSARRASIRLHAKLAILNSAVSVLYLLWNGSNGDHHERILRAWKRLEIWGDFICQGNGKIWYCYSMLNSGPLVVCEFIAKPNLFHSTERRLILLPFFLGSFSFKAFVVNSLPKRLCNILWDIFSH